MDESFTAFVVTENEGQYEGKVDTISLDQLPDGEVVVDVEFSSLNYKDALAASGLGRVAGGYPHVPGIDAAGSVAQSRSSKFSEGDRVLITGYGLGAPGWGGYSKYVRVPADWVVKSPEGLTNHEAMALGTAGFTAAMCLLAIERNGGTPDQGPVLVTGSTGGVGSLAVNMLAGKGYSVAASTGKADAHDFLKQLGAEEILGREEVSLTDERPRPMLKATWGSAIDTVGGATHGYLIRTLKPHGSIALCGLVGGTEFPGTVVPFLLRGINVLGIDSVACPMGYREEIWRRLATDLKPEKLEQIAETISLADLPESVSRILKGEIRGRRVVAVQNE